VLAVNARGTLTSQL
jgi:hypothetical protein